MPINVEDIVERAFEQAFAKALEQILQAKAEAIFQKAFSNGSPLSQKLESKIEEGFQRFIEDGIRWDKKKHLYRIRVGKYRVVYSIFDEKVTVLIVRIRHRKNADD
jgi:mRNA-degrading endonuclease RelE of RelBE toxin-antitoxin system